jgi:phosphoribosylformylglycinamidine cyclo-ligase
MPGMYEQDDYDLAGFAVGVVDRPKLIDGSRIRAGHVVLGLGSSGPHSNGYSLIRKVLERSGEGPSTPLGGGTLGDALLAPTRIYVKTLLELIDKHPLDGLAHITGGGISENIIRVIPAGLGLELDLSAWTLPAVFQWLQSRGGIEENEMLRTFNCGIGMALLASEAAADAICAALSRAGEPVYRLGRVVDCRDGGRRVNYIRS